MPKVVVFLITDNINFENQQNSSNPERAIPSGFSEWKIKVSIIISFLWNYNKSKANSV